MHDAKLARPDHPILDCIAKRWSPYSFAPRTVEPDKLWSCFEAARWAASSFNEQPWSFIVAQREDLKEFQRILECLAETNQAWARNAGVLVLTVIARSFSRNGSANRVAEHDLGLAVGNFCCQATHLGLAVHQMAGVQLEKVRQEFAIPESHAPVTAMAVGYVEQDPMASSNPYAQRDANPRTRKPLQEFVFTGNWQSR